MSGGIAQREAPVLARFADICVDKIEFFDPTQKPHDPFTYVDISSIDNRRKCICSPKRLIGREAPSRARQIIHEADVLVSTTRPNLNAVAFVPPELDGAVCSTGFCVLRSNGRVEPEYLFRYVQSDVFVQKLSALVQGALYPAVTDKQVRNQQISLPSLETQRKTLVDLRDQLAEAERARKAVEAQLQAAEVLPGAFFKHVFSSSALQQWPGVPLGECCDLLPSKSICLNGDAEVQAITSACLTEWGFTEKGIKASRMWAKDVPLAVAQAGEILISRSNTPELVGRVSIFPGTSLPVVASDLTIRIMPRPFVSGAFITAYLSNLFISGFWKHRAGGASGTMKKITRRQIENLILRLPALPEQNKHVMTLNAELQGARLLRTSIEQKLSDIEKLPAALLREAFTGAT